MAPVTSSLCISLLMAVAAAAAATPVMAGGDGGMMAEWAAASGGYSYPLFGEADDDDDHEGMEEEEEEVKEGRRSLLWRRIHRYSYISYGALSANRIPCPARSGRSYYTHDCYHARGPVRPYTRGCSAITRCRR